MRLILLFGLLLIGSLIGPSAYAEDTPIPIPPAEANCAPPANRSPEVVVTSTRSAPQFSYNESSNDLGAKAAGNTYKPSGVGGPRWHTGGLTQSNISIEPDVENHILVNSTQNSSCAYIEKVRLNVVLAPVVWVANNFPEGSCMYNAVRDHELKHVHADQTVLTQHIGRIRAALTDVTEGRAFFGPGTPDAVKASVATFFDQLKSTLARETQSFAEDDMKAQRAIDTMQEYQRISHLCPKQTGDAGN
jgi:hypothetical protein